MGRPGPRYRREPRDHPAAGSREIDPRAARAVSPGVREVRAACRAVDEPGVAMIAIDEITGQACRHLHAARARRALCRRDGRPSRCMRSVSAAAAMTSRCATSRSSSIRSAAGRATRRRSAIACSISARRPAFATSTASRSAACAAKVRRCCAVGGFALFILPLGAPSDWPESGNDAWEMIPERVYFDELDERARELDPAHAWRATSRTRSTHVSMIMRTAGPRETGDSLVMPGAGVGTLELIGRHHRGTLTLGHARAARRRVGRSLRALRRRGPARRSVAVARPRAAARRRGCVPRDRYGEPQRHAAATVRATRA